LNMSTPTMFLNEPRSEGADASARPSNPGVPGLRPVSLAVLPARPNCEGTGAAGGAAWATGASQPVEPVKLLRADDAESARYARRENALFAILVIGTGVALGLAFAGLQKLNAHWDAMVNLVRALIS